MFHSNLLRFLWKPLICGEKKSIDLKCFSNINEAKKKLYISGQCTQSHVKSNEFFSQLFYFLSETDPIRWDVHVFFCLLCTCQWIETPSLQDFICHLFDLAGNHTINFQTHLAVHSHSKKGLDLYRVCPYSNAREKNINRISKFK